MIKLTKQEAIKADDFLRLICDHEIVNNQEKIYSFFNNIIEAHEICEYIEFRGFIHITKTDADKKIYSISPLPQAHFFVKNGGFKEECKLEGKMKYSVSLKKTSTIIAIIASILSIILMLLTFIQNQNIKEIKRLTEYEYKSNLKKALIGKWKLQHSTQVAYYIFYEDNSWEYFYFESEKKITYKGEFQLGSNNGVFLRKFGSQHWFHDTTYVDIQSGIGTSYYYLKGNILNNNQEDYTNSYIKME